MCEGRQRVGLIQGHNKKAEALLLDGNRCEDVIFSLSSLDGSDGGSHVVTKDGILMDVSVRGSGAAVDVAYVGCMSTES